MRYSRFPLRIFALTTVLALALGADPALANSPPATPVINEPATDGQIVNPADVHMQTVAFSDPDGGDTHLCSDWEIFTITPVERVWSALCIGGVERVHVHLGDGNFEGSYAGRHALEFDSDYRLRARHRDSSGDAATEWSDYGLRLFHTGSPTSIFPMRMQDVVAAPPPEWRDGATASIILPAGSPQPEVRVESPSAALLLAFRGLDGNSNTIVEPGPLAGDVAVRVVVAAGDTGTMLPLPESQITFTDNAGFDRTIYLPALSLSVGSSAYFWVAADGGTYAGTPAQTTPDFSTLARGAPVPWVVRQPGFAVEIVATGFQLPVNVAFIPNPGNQPTAPLYYVAELYGAIKVVRRNGTVGDYATGLLNFDPLGQFPGAGEQGLAGLVVDPASGDVFASMLYDAGGPHYPKVVRFHSTDGGQTAATMTTILDLVGETQGQSHQISNLSIGPDGKLYVHVGDGFDSSTAQNLDSFRGKILRVNLDGSAAVGNPFYDASNGISARDYVYAYGFRNPFGGAWSAADGFHYSVENGPSVDRFARIVPGRNYLWDGSDASMHNFAIYNWDPATAPVNIAFVQTATFGGSGFPATKMGHAFVSESGGTYATGPGDKRVIEFAVDANGGLVSGPTTLVEYAGTGKATAVGLSAGPDGLYFTDLYKDQDYASPIDVGANVLRIKYLGTADLTADVLFGNAPLTVPFFDTSTVPSPTAWNWSFGDGGISARRNPTHTYTHDGVYDVTLRVTGANGVRVTRKTGFICVGTTCTQGLRGEYFDDIALGTPVLTRTDPTVDFDWGGGSPDPSIGPDTFSVRWTGEVTALASETYTFSTIVDDGVRLWIDDQLVIDEWIDQAPTEWSGTFPLVAGVPASIRMEYYENGVGAVARLLWSSPSTPKEVIPADRLSPPSPVSPPPPCPATPKPSCRVPAIPRTASLLIKNGSTAAKNRLVWKWLKAAATDVADFGNPIVTTGYRLCVYDGTPSLVADAAVHGAGSCAGRPCWKRKGAGFGYRDNGGAADGITKVTLYAGAGTTAKIALTAAGTALDVPPLPVATPITVQLLESGGGCWGARYSAPARNDGQQLKARAD